METTKRDSPDPVALAVWPWRQRSQVETAVEPPSHAAAVVVQTVVAAAVASFLFRKSHFVPACAVAAVAGVLALCSVAWPAGYHGIHRMFQMLGVWLGRALTYVLLAPCFVIVFGVAHLLVFLARRDPLGCRPARDRSTYWEARAPVADPAKRLEVPY